MFMVVVGDGETLPHLTRLTVYTSHNSHSFLAFVGPQPSFLLSSVSKSSVSNAAHRLAFLLISQHGLRIKPQCRVARLAVLAAEHTRSWLVAC